MKSITRWDVAVGIFLFLVGYNGSTQIMMLCLIAFFLWLLVRPKAKAAALSASAGVVSKALAFMSAPESEAQAEEEDNCFEIDSHAEGGTSIELGVDIDYRPCPNHFRLDYRYDTASSKSEYEYRVDGVRVFVRLINDIDNSVGTARGGDWEVRDGVVLEQDLRDRFNAQSDFIKRAFPEIDEKIANLRTLTEWREMKPLDFNGVLGFILSKTAPPADIRRLYRGELERIKAGVALVRKEFDRIGLEPSPESKDGMRVRDGGPHPDLDETIWERAHITSNEFWSRDRTIARLEELLSSQTKKS